ncbi:MAG: class I SAM-dependent RNA methyltransferase [Deltaproteobacteria bacterium]|nr:class I SAM-dependent RNA methyltransferase [Deltaproteobacteria bacterium]
MREEKVVVIERLAHGGNGVGRINNKVVFVPGTVPGDRVKICITESRGRFDRGEVLEILEPSPGRISPRCSVFGLCGGCQWQHLDYATQLREKTAILKESLQRIGKIADVIPLPIIPSPHHWNYRQRIQLHTDAESHVGFYRSERHEVVEFNRCEIAFPRLNEHLQGLKSNGYKNFPRHFELAVDGEEVTLFPLEEEGRFFSQVNPELNERLIETVLHFALGRSEPAFTKKWTLVELYCGSGNFTFSLARRVGKVFAVEHSLAALQEAEKRAAHLGLTNIEFLQGSAEWGLKRFYRRKSPVDILLLDPPRQGASEILDLIIVLKPRVIVYVSCDPTTLARDVGFWSRHRYRLEEVQPLDMFPQTYHLETVVKLVRA